MQDLEPRINRMYRRDQLISLALVAVLIVTLVTVYVEISPFARDTGVRAVLAAAGLVLVLFNAASIWAMLRHNREDKRYIYALDLKHLDEHRLARLARGREGPR
jgi:hypothetical protein